MMTALLGPNRFRNVALSAACVLGAIASPSPGRAQAAEPEQLLRRSFAQPALIASTPEQFAPAVAPVAPPAPAAAPAKPAPDWPKFVPAAGKTEPPPAAPDVFTVEEIATARGRCAVLLKGLDVVVTEEPAIKSGACGTPAPVQLISLGKNPQVTLTPPASMTCEMVAALHKWMADDIQPLAKKHLGVAVVGLQTMSSYSCRNAYGRKRGFLSEHGKANAIDIGGFVMANTHQTSVLTDWGPTGIEIRAQIAAAQAAAKLAAEKAAALKVAADKIAATKPKPNGTTAPGATAATEAPAIGTIIEGVPGITNRLPGAGPANEGRSGYGLIRPSNLGGPKSSDKPVTPDAAAAILPADLASQSRKARFLREAHTAACKIFGTTLGPETNLAHKNHFHLDMAERARSNFCE